MKRYLWVLLLFVVVGAASKPAHANALGDIEKLYNAIPADLRPAELSDIEDILNACQGGLDSQPCLTAAANVANSDGDLPSWIPMWINIYFDIQKRDYWALLEDAGKEIACVAANVVFDVDICGAIEDLITAAKDVAHDVSAAIQFLGEILGDVGTGLKDAYCGLGLGSLFGGCDSSNPQPPPAEVAFANYYYPRLAQGLSARESDPTQWSNYASKVQSDCAAALGPNASGCQPAFTAFQSAIYADWDSDIVGNWIPQVKNRQHSNWTAATALPLVKNYPALVNTNEPWSYNSYAESTVASQCTNDLVAMGSQKVQDWISAGRPAADNIPAPWAYQNSLCADFNASFDKAAKQSAFQQGLALLDKAGFCSKTSSNPLVYDCSKPGDVYGPTDCDFVLTTLGKLALPNKCIGPGPVEATYLCGGVSVKKPVGQYAGCTLQYGPGGAPVAPSAKCQALRQESAQCMASGKKSNCQDIDKQIAKECPATQQQQPGKVN